MNTVTVHRCLVRKQVRWYVSRIQGGKRKRSFHNTKTEADNEAEQLRLQIQNTQQAWASLPAHHRQRLVEAYAKSLELGVDIFHALELASRQPTSDGPILIQAITELIEAKEKAGRSKKYTKGLKIVLKQFAKGRENMRIGRVGLTDLEAYLDSKRVASRSTLRSRLSTLFKFAIRRGWRIDNPCQRLETVTVPSAPPAIFTIKQVKTCLRVLRKHRHALPWFILSTFCGLRPEEAQQTTKDDIHIKEGWIKVEAQTTKVRQRRVVYPRPEAMRLLEMALKKGKLPIRPLVRRRVMRKMRTRLKLEAWPKDITRHTAASYWLASDGASPAHVADMLGHSESVLRKNYKALVTQEQARVFWQTLGRVSL